MTVHDFVIRKNGRAQDPTYKGGRFDLSSFPPRAEAEDQQPCLITGPGSLELKSQWFNVDRTACFLVSANSHVLEMNAAAELSLLKEDFLSVRRGALKLDCERSNAVLASAIAIACGGQSKRRRELVRGSNLEWRLIDVVGPGGQPVAFISYRCPPALSDRLAGLADAFGLTQTESRVLGELIEGHAPKDIGFHLNMCTATVRTHLRSICAKTNAQGINGALRLFIPLL